VYTMSTVIVDNLYSVDHSSFMTPRRPTRLSETPAVGPETVWRLRRLGRKVDEATVERNRAIVEAHRDGMSLRAIADHECCSVSSGNHEQHCGFSSGSTVRVDVERLCKFVGYRPVRVSNGDGSAHFVVDRRHNFGGVIRVTRWRRLRRWEMVGMRR
jgi:hypothetical protein